MNPTPWRHDPARGGVRFQGGQLYRLIHTQAIEIGRAHVGPDRIDRACRIGGGSGSMNAAQSRCRWWIPGMMALLAAIEAAPEPRKRSQSVHTRGIDNALRAW